MRISLTIVRRTFRRTLMSTLSKRTITGTVAIALLATTVLVAALAAQAQDAGRPASDRRGTSTDGRFQIVMRDGVRADTFLLDTQEGKVWQQTQITDVEGQPTVWMFMERIDSKADYSRLLAK
ncbi:MAG: hypothetical protein HGA97_12645 [Chlorobiaceae bacterium]|nr:hypothetical protein [Chlorobiaceae bacterium]